MRDYIEEHSMGIANDIIENNATAWQTAKAFGGSKVWYMRMGKMGWFAWVIESHL